MSAEPDAKQQAELQAELARLAQPMSTAEEKKLLRELLYGDPGSGKTDLAVKTAYEIGQKTALISTDSAWVTVLKYPDIAKTVTRYPFAGFSQLRAIAYAHSQGIAPYCEFDTLIWDTVSTAVQKVLRNLVDARKYPKEQHDPEVEGWPHYRLVERALMDTVDVLSNSGLHIIYVAHLRDPTSQDKEKKRFAIRPDMPDACFKAVAREVQLVGWVYKEAKGSQRKLQLEGTLQETAKSQISTLEEKTYEVNQIPSLIKKWTEAE